MSDAPAIAASTRYADWKAPRGDGELLIWPAPARLIEDARRNQHLLNTIDQSRLGGVSLLELRRESRRWIGHTDDRPLIATGHQTELHHPGVWMKNAIIHAVAEAVGGQAYHFAVDSDSPKHLILRWPPDGSRPITDDPSTGSSAWSGLLEAPSPPHLDEIERDLRLASSGWGFTPVIGDVISALRRAAPMRRRLPDALCHALHRLDWSLGLRYHAMTVSTLFVSPPYLAVVAGLLADARRFALAYNGALRAYRSAYRLRSNTRPMPDLFVSDTAIEMPFWLDDLEHGTRTRPSVFDRGGGGFVLKLVSGEEIAFPAGEDAWASGQRLARFLSGTAHRLAPRALVLTMFFRVFLADQFVHGIGGGRYDQVLDRLIREHFAIEPPGFAVATATMLFPPAVGRARACVPCVEHQGHQLRHRALGERKRELVSAISGLPRRSRQRRRAFDEMRQALRQAWESSPQAESWQQMLTHTREQERRDAVEFDRELFYGLQPRDRLDALIERVGGAFTGV